MLNLRGQISFSATNKRSCALPPRLGGLSTAAIVRGSAGQARRHILASQQGDAPSSSTPPPSTSSDATVSSSTEHQEATSTAEPAAPAASSSTSSEGAAQLDSTAVISKLQASEPVDRLRYQAQLMFEELDTDGDGKLSAAELSSWFSSVARKVLWSPGLAEVLAGVQQQYTSSTAAAAAAGGATRDGFVRIVRAQVQAISCSPAYTGSAFRPDEAARLQATMSMSLQEVCAAKWVFTLLDANNDGKVELALLSRAQGIEAYMYEDKMEDADADEDGALTFEEFLISYAKPKAVGKNALIMVLNTAVIYLVLQAPWLDVMIKVLVVGLLVLRPQIISKPALVLYDIIKSILDRGKAEAELAKANRGVWRPAS